MEKEINTNNLYTYNMKKYIIINADYNDGDYVTEKSLITDEELILIQPIIDGLKENDGDFTTLDQGDSGEEQFGKFEGFDTFYNFIPSAEYGIHTIESIEILEVINEIRLL